ncbi:MAG: ATP-binding protein [Bosea sp.]|nr:ATP-binding protein [Bosea sp. (in: a-proteobacteria)]
MTTTRFDRVFKAEHGAIATLMAAFGSFAEVTSLPADAVFKIELALDELMNNTIDYGYPDGDAGEISVAIERLPGRVTIDYADDARLFDPFALPEPDVTLGIDARQPGGLGVHLVRKLMSESAYSVERDRNHIRLGLVLDDPS